MKRDVFLNMPPILTFVTGDEERCLNELAPILIFEGRDEERCLHKLATDIDFCEERCLPTLAT